MADEPSAEELRAIADAELTALVPNRDPATPADLKTDSGWNLLPRGARDITADLRSGVAIPIGSFNGETTVITYSFAPKTFDADKRTEKLTPMSVEKIQAALAAMEEIKRVANVTFEPAKFPAAANITFVEGENIADLPPEQRWDGLAPETGPHRQVVVNRHAGEPEYFDQNHSGYATMVHEILHTMGLSHYGGSYIVGNGQGGNEPEQYKAPGNDSRMGHTLVNKERQHQGLGVDDIAALQYVYNKSKLQPGDVTLTPEKLSEMNSINARGNATIDLKETAGYAELDLSGQNTLLTLSTLRNGSLLLNDAQVTVPQKMKVRFDSDSPNTSVVVTGRSDADIAGTRGDDVLLPRDGGNTMKGGEGRDKFILDTKAGVSNFISDFNPEEDKLIVAPGAKMHVIAADHYVTVQLGKDKAHPVASVLIADVTEEQIKAAIVRGKPSVREMAREKMLDVLAKFDVRRGDHLVDEWVKKADAYITEARAPANLDERVNVLPTWARVPELDPAHSESKDKIIAHYQKELKTVELQRTERTFGGGYMRFMVRNGPEYDGANRLNDAIDDYVRAQAKKDVREGKPVPSVHEMQQRVTDEMDKGWTQTMKDYRYDTSHDSTTQPREYWLNASAEYYENKTTALEGKGTVQNVAADILKAAMAEGKAVAKAGEQKHGAAAKAVKVKVDDVDHAQAQGGAHHKHKAQER